MLTALLSTAIFPAYSLKTEVIFSEIANLTYQLDTVSGVLRSGNPADFQKLWNDQFLKSDKDRAELERWRALRQKYDRSVSFPTVTVEFNRIQSRISLEEAIRAAGLEATSEADFAKAINALVLPTDSSEFLRTIRYFGPRFRRWWEKEASPKGVPFASKMQALLEQPNITDLIGNFNKFYGSELPTGYRAPFSLIYRPMLVITSTSGQQFGRMSVVEFNPSEKPKQRLDVVLHEFCHFLYGTRDPMADQKLQSRFAVLKDPLVRPAFNLMNEGLATALGNGVIGRLFREPNVWDKYLATPSSFYNDSNIDRAGKSLLKLMDKWLPLGKTMDDPEFVDAYMTALRTEFGSELSAPSLYLNDTFMWMSASFGRDLVGKVIQSSRIASASIERTEKPSREDFKDHFDNPNLTSMFILPPSQLDALATTGVLEPSHLADLRRAINENDAAVLSIKKGAMAYTFIVVAPDSESVLAQIKRMTKLKAAFLGVLKDER